MLPNESPLAAMSAANDHGADDDDDGDTLGESDLDPLHPSSPSSPDHAKPGMLPGPPPHSRARDSDLISVLSDATSVKSSKSKKRVQFLPEGLMVRVREIPPRSNKSSSESDGSASETSSDSECSDTEESEETSSAESRTPSPAQTVSATTFTTMPPLVWTPGAAAKGSYTVAKQSAKTVSNVSKITGIHQRTGSPATSSSGTAAAKNSPRRIRRTPSPKLEKRAKKSSPKLQEKAAVSVSVKSLDNALKSKPQRKPTQPRKDGKSSPPGNSHKQSSKSKQSPVHNSNSNSNSTGSNSLKLTALATKVTLAQRRVNSAPTTKLVAPKRISSISHAPTVSTSVTLLPAQQQTDPRPSMDHVGRAMQSLTMGQLYTIDGFIFPSHQAPEVHLPDVLTPFKSEDIGQASSSPSRLTSPRRSLDSAGTSLYHHAHPQHQQQHHPHHHNQGQASPTSATRKKRHAWQMAEGGAQSTLNNGPSIAQLWDQGPSCGTPVLHKHI